MLRGYAAIGITGKSFRDALIYSLEKNNLEYKEELSAIILTESGVHLNVAIQDWIGSGMLKVKKNNGDFDLDKIVNGMKAYYDENNTKTNNFTSILYVFLGVILIALSIAMISLKLNHRSSHHSGPVINVNVK